MIDKYEKAFIITKKYSKYDFIWTYYFCRHLKFKNADKYNKNDRCHSNLHHLLEWAMELIIRLEDLNVFNCQPKSWGG